MCTIFWPWEWDTYRQTIHFTPRSISQKKNTLCFNISHETVTFDGYHLFVNDNYVVVVFVCCFLNKEFVIFLVPGRWTCDMCGMCASCLRRSPGEGNTSRWKHEVCSSTLIFSLHYQYIINQQGDENKEMNLLENNVFIYIVHLKEL